MMAALKGVQPAHRLGVQADQVVVAVRQQAQHGGVINRRHHPQSVMTHGHDRRGSGVMGVALVAVTGVE
jgi:hypothetical protein